MRPSRNRVWRIRLAIRGLLKGGRASGADMERLLGHMCFTSLIRRESLSILKYCYRFVTVFKGSREAKTLWSSVKRELDLWDSLAPLLWLDSTSPPSPDVVMVDASPWGLGAVRASAPPELVSAASRYSERWRLRGDEKPAPRQACLP